MDFISDKLADYLNKNSEKEPEILSRLSKETHQKILQPRMLSGHVQGRFLSFISKLNLLTKFWRLEHTLDTVLFV